MAALPAPGVLVLDDYHLVCAPAVHAAVAILLEHLPPALHLVAASREDPPLPLPRLCARRQLVEVRAAELGFSVEEAATLLGAGMGAPGRGAGGGAGRLVDRVGADVLRLLAARRCNAGIAAELVVEQSTVKSHLSHVYSALGLHSRTQAWPARRGCWADIGRGFHPASPPSGGRPPPATPPS